MGYTRDAVKGVTWAGALRFFTRIISVGKLVVIARILTPLQFGAFGIASIVLSFTEIVTETGINVFLLQEKENIEKYINTAWVVSILRGILIASVILLSAPLVSKFFSSENSLNLLLLIALVPFIKGFINPSIIKFQKELNFNKEFYFRSSIFLVDSLAAIILVFLTHSVQSLIWGFVAGALLEVILSFMLAKPIPKFIFQKDLVREVLHSGKWVTGYGILSNLFNNLPDIVIGKVLGPASLGLYQMGNKVAMMPITEVSEVIAKVTFPVYVKISDDKERLKRAFKKTTLAITVFSLLVGLFVIVFADQIILLLGEKWEGTVNVLRILAVFAVVKSIAGSPAILFLTLKKQKYVTAFTFVSLLALAIVIFPLMNLFGLEGAALSVLIGYLFAIPLILYFLWRTKI